MPLSYTEISEEIGYTGYTPYPPIESVQRLFENLCSEPTIEDFKLALKLYRFTPEAKTDDQYEVIFMMQKGMSIAMERLYLEEPKRTISDTVREYLHKWVPTAIFVYLAIAI